MAFDLKPDQATLFKNDKKGNQSAPDYTGEINIGGKVRRLAAWIKDGKKGKWMSLSISDKQATRVAGDDDSSPF